MSNKDKLTSILIILTLMVSALYWVYREIEADNSPIDHHYNCK